MKYLFLLLLSLLLTGCATLPSDQAPLNQSMSWEARKTQLQTVQTWKLEGAMAIKTPQGGQTANLAWTQSSAQSYEINLFGPLGAGRISLLGQPNEVTLQANGKTQTADSPELLMQDMLGWQLPVSHAYVWIRGLPATQSHAVLTFDAYHHLNTLQQNGWTIRYLQFTNVNGIDLPSKIIFERSPLLMVVVIHSWELS
jgi:outer membrane lipoprotein LolB